MYACLVSWGVLNGRNLLVQRVARFTVKDLPANAAEFGARRGGSGRIGGELETREVADSDWVVNVALAAAVVIW